MKIDDLRLIIPISIVILVVICLLGYLFLSAITNGGMKHIDAISATDLLYETKISFPISFDKGYQSGGVLTSFISKMTMNGIVELVQNNNPYSELQISCYDAENSILIMDLKNSQKAIYLIRKEAKSNKYVLFNMAAEFMQYPDPLDKNQNRNDVKIIFPYHLVDDSNFYIGRIIRQNTNYMTTHTIDDFYTFYLDLDSYVIEKSNDEIVIVRYKDPLVSENAPDIKNKIHISFESMDSGQYFRVTYK